MMKNKKLIFIGLSLLLVLFISGCGTGEVVKDIENQVVCNKPYILVGTECCLDQNDNSICDTDESQSPTETPLLSQGITVESCESGSIFKCESYAINKDKITLKLKSPKADYYAIKRIYLPQITLNGCELEMNSSFVNALGYKEIKTFEIPCNIDKESVDTELFIDYIYYKSTNGIYGFDVENENGKFIAINGSSKGYIMGMVR